MLTSGDRRILILSPQEWAHIRVSKHHYAEELVRAGNEVFFLNPPSNKSVSGGVVLQRVNEFSGPGQLTVIDWNRRTPLALRFKALPIYKRLIRSDIRRIEAAIAAPVDILWSFEPNTFPDLAEFRAAQIIYMPVDPLSRATQYECADKADLIVSISNEILDNFQSPRFAGRTLLVDHGVSATIEAEARRPALPRERGGPVRAGFFGNLDRPVINHEAFGHLIRAHPDVEFHFWGPASPDGPFAQGLDGRPNVKAHGSVDKYTLIEAIKQIDIFLLIYRTDHTYDRSNAHKILEYLATGKVVVSSLISRYADRWDLLRAPASGDDSEIPGIFAQTLSQLDVANAPELMARRKAYALEHTYRSQLARIDAALTARRAQPDAAIV